MTVPITALYAGILGLLITALAINVTVHRAKLKVDIGDGGNAQMLRMIRVHANAVEYVPLGLLLLGLYELDQGWPAVLHAAGIALIVGRVLHVAGLWNTAGLNFGRGAGVTLTWITIAALAVLNLWQIR
jgi:uncharacterized membrane protein YecN with MAPEG domain